MAELVLRPLANYSPRSQACMCGLSDPRGSRQISQVRSGRATLHAGGSGVQPYYDGPSKHDMVKPGICQNRPG